LGAYAPPNKYNVKQKILILYIMHPGLRKGPLFTNKTPPFSTFFYKKNPPHFLPTGLLDVERERERDIFGGELARIGHRENRQHVHGASSHWEDYAVRQLHTIRYDTRCYFNVRSKANISQLNLPHGTDN